jgi:hypothetical protein
MKINILGVTIDTEKIYQVTEIRKPNNWQFNDSEDSQDDSRDWLYSFKIVFDNNSEMVITSPYQLGKSKKAEDYLVDVRKQVIDWWSNNQSDIPKIEFKKIENQ